MRRDGAPFRVVRSAELVPGDIVRVSVGCRVPADLRLVALGSTTLRADQAILTGESEPAMKEAAPVVDAAHKEDALDDAAFLAALGHDRAAFASLPAWKKTQLKKKAGLF